jgi:hypothetical protein
MSITKLTTPTIANEPITLAEAKTQLRVTHNLDDAEITAKIFTARAEAESYSMRTLQLSVSWVRRYDGWPLCMRFDDPPLISLPHLPRHYQIHIIILIQ